MSINYEIEYVDSKESLFDGKLSDDVPKSIEKTSTGERIDSGDADQSKIQYVKCPTQSDVSDTSSTGDSSRDNDKVDSAHVDQYKFVTDVKEFEKTASFSSIGYKSDVCR